MRRPPRTRDVTTAGAAVLAALEWSGVANDVRGARLAVEWSDLVGPRIAQRTRPDRIDGRVLWIEVATSAWLHELNLMKPQLLAGLLERLGEPRLFEDLRLKLAARSRREGTTAPRRRAPLPVVAAPPPRPATGAAREAIVREVASVDDAELRELIARVRIQHDR